jgi:alkylation response protein AidB-like acyl-CoA dehydrogenase
MVRQLVDNELIPNVHEWDEAGEIPASFRIKAYFTGMAVLACGHPLPIEYGPTIPDFLRNVKIDEFHAIVVFQEIARAGSIGIGWGLGAGLTIGLPPVLHHGSEYLKQKVAPPVLRGEKVICLAVTEPNAGSDASNVQTTAVKSPCGKYYIVNGVKKWITNGIFADFMTVLVRTKEGAGAKGLSMLLIETDSPGVKRQKMKCSGVWASGTTLISFDNVRVPVEHLIGKENKGFKYCVSNFNHERLIICAQAVASARVCYEQAWKHAHRRKTFGKPLIDHQVIRLKLGEMARQIEGCQAWLENIAFQIETMHPREATMKLSGPAALLKVQCTKTLELCARESSQIFGGLSFTRGGLGEMVERISREVKSLVIPGGSEEIMLDLGVKMTTKLSMLGRQMLSMDSPQLRMAQRVGVNTDLFGEGFAFGDPSWYITFNSAFYNQSHRVFRNWIRELIERGLKIVEKAGEWDEGHCVPGEVRKAFLGSGLGFLAAGYPYAGAGDRIEILRGVQIDMFHELIAVDELSRTGSAGIVMSLWSSVADATMVLKSLPPSPAVNKLILEICSGERRCAVVRSENIEVNEGKLSGFIPVMMDTDCLLVNGTDGVFLVEKCDSVKVNRARTSGSWAANPVTVIFENTVGTCLGKPASSPEQALMKTRWVGAVEATRFARLCYEQALKHAQENDLDKNQGTRWKLGEMARQVEAAFCWLEGITYHINTRTTSADTHVSLLRMHATKVFEYCAREAAQILGTMATLRGSPVERMSREVRTLAFVGGTEEALLDNAVLYSMKEGISRKVDKETTMVARL